MGFGTTRVVGKTLNKTGLSATQMKGMSTLQNICGVKKTDDKIDQNALLKINQLKSEAPNKSKLMSDLEDNTKEEAKSSITKPEETLSTEKPKIVKKPFSLKNLI